MTPLEISWLPVSDRNLWAPAVFSSMDPLMGTAGLGLVDDSKARISGASPVPTMCLTKVFSKSFTFVL
jgi:hypothetical protein